MTQTKMTRRGFIEMSALALAGGVLAYLTVRNPKVDLVEAQYGGNEMKKKILVAYASRAGSTAGVADAIGKTLAESGANVDVLSVKEITDLSPYQAVVAGSAVRNSKWLPEAMNFLRGYQAELNSMPFAAFQVCLTLAVPGKDYSEFAAGWLEPVRALAKPVSEGMFAGVLDYSKLSFSDGLGLRVFAAATKTQPGDYRDWDVIKEWAEDLAGKL
jgi:menaquinone-dependent protoporphyrinogen oxidase